jgi:hypothetical protein
VSKKPVRRPVAAVPAPRRYRVPPPLRHVARVPRGETLTHTPTAHVARAPKLEPLGKPPNPRKPKLVRDVHGNELKDLFQMFPDLPRPRRPAPRVRPQRKARRK